MKVWQLMRLIIKYFITIIFVCFVFGLDVFGGGTLIHHCVIPGSPLNSANGIALGLLLLLSFVVVLSIEKNCHWIASLLLLCFFIIGPIVSGTILVHKYIPAVSLNVAIAIPTIFMLMGLIIVGCFHRGKAAAQ